MAEVIQSDTALEDLNNIGDYIAKDSVKYAEITVLLFSRPDASSSFPNGFQMRMQENSDCIAVRMIIARELSSPSHDCSCSA